MFKLFLEKFGIFSLKSLHETQIAKIYSKFLSANVKKQRNSKGLTCKALCISLCPLKDSEMEMKVSVKWP